MHQPALTGRFAPSPSGPLHVGNLRTALLAWLFARSAGAAFLVRIEDLDAERSRREHELAQLADLRALGLDWDGVPVRQSERGALYRDAFEQLRAAGLLYPCWCTRAEIREAVRAPHRGDAQRAYPGTCRNLDAQARRVRERGSRPPSWRLDANAREMSVVDRLHGPLTAVVDDFIVWRGDPDRGAGSACAYNLAVVVDDAEQGVGEVVRGDDLLASSPRQALLATLLGRPVPAYAHVPLVLGRDGRRLAKRHGAVTLGEQRRAGVDVAAVVAWMGASAGLAEPGERLSADALLARFDPARLTRAPSTFDGAPLAAPAA